ncbi:MAG: hypothetical protein QF614_09260, partial [SAR324 cluster bacterium]|nr:hypothetical protein [SAR324 cluster bacterium]
GTDPKTLNPVGTEGTQWTLSKTIETGDNGPLEFRLRYTDLAGNSGEEVTATTDGSAVTMDTTAPEVSSVSLVSDNANSALGKRDDTVTLSFTTSEPIQTPMAGDVTLGSLTDVTITPLDDEGKSWKAKGTVPASVNGSVSLSLRTTRQRTVRSQATPSRLPSPPANPSLPRP